MGKPLDERKLVSFHGFDFAFFLPLTCSRICPPDLWNTKSFRVWPVLMWFCYFFLFACWFLFQLQLFYFVPQAPRPPLNCYTLNHSISRHQESSQHCNLFTAEVFTHIKLWSEETEKKKKRKDCKQTFFSPFAPSFSFALAPQKQALVSHALILFLVHIV